MNTEHLLTVYPSCHVLPLSDYLNEDGASSQSPEHSNSRGPSSSLSSNQTNVPNQQHTDTQSHTHTPRGGDRLGPQSRNRTAHANESKSRSYGGDISGTGGWDKHSSVGQSSADWPTLGQPNLPTQAQWLVGVGLHDIGNTVGAGL